MQHVQSDIANMPALTHEDEAFIEHLMRNGHKPLRIIEAFELLGRGSRTAIYVRTKRFETNGTVFPISKGGRPRLISPEIREFIVEVLKKKGGKCRIDTLQSMIVKQYDQWFHTATIARAVSEARVAHNMEEPIPGYIEFDASMRQRGTAPE
ncbi:hypothetical protein LTR78_002103 [Recurvomyces mirabilis]|uniref:Uncharacterized protein n=1 Tax=Recurvomyces mirabilis TaxID=574656 RepID=A0AAE0WTZ5_9PEZI|nr:hypothetical protein LTR78_002103 [Recurvomyces mirabilis]KAK5160561.1 hypothetical protein LTS14_001573 [Recurvomyces mirabilis]